MITMAKATETIGKQPRYDTRYEQWTVQKKRHKPPYFIMIDQRYISQVPEETRRRISGRVFKSQQAAYAKGIELFGSGAVGWQIKNREGKIVRR